MKAFIDTNVDNVSNTSVIDSVVEAMGAVISGDEAVGRKQTDEKVSQAQDNATKAFEDIMLIQDASDLAHFREMYDIIGDIKKIY